MNIDNAIIRYMGYSKTADLIARNIPIEEANFIDAIIGPRRAGKTSLMMLYMNKLTAAESNKIFINGEDVDFVGIKVDDLDRIEEAIYRIYKPITSKKVYLFIDEVQTFPEWQRWLRTLFDQHRYNIVVSGSTSELSLDKLHSELRGRAINTLVFPFSFGEYLNAKGVSASKYPKIEESAELSARLADFLEFGGYPEIAKNEDSKFRRTALSALYSTVVQRDLIERYKIRKTEVFKSFVNSLFGSACRELSIPKLVGWFASQGIKISNQSASNYVSYAGSAFLVFLLYPYSRKIKERNTKPKLYVTDSGILGIFDADKTKKLENQVFVELIRRNEKIYYYKTGSADVDFVLSKDDNSVKELIQVSYSINSAETHERESGSLFEASAKLGCANLTIITFNETGRIKSGGRSINVIPAWKWFLDNLWPK